MSWLALIGDLITCWVTDLSGADRLEYDGRTS